MFSLFSNFLLCNYARSPVFNNLLMCIYAWTPVFSSFVIYNCTNTCVHIPVYRYKVLINGYSNTGTIVHKYYSTQMSVNRYLYKVTDLKLSFTFHMHSFIVNHQHVVVLMYNCNYKSRSIRFDGFSCTSSLVRVPADRHLCIIVHVCGCLLT